MKMRNVAMHRGAKIELAVGRRDWKLYRGRIFDECISNRLASKLV